MIREIRGPDSGPCNSWPYSSNQRIEPRRAGNPSRLQAASLHSRNLGGSPFALYRMLARNGFESPQSVTVAPTQPWTSAPNIYIWTTWKDTGAPVNNVDWYVAEIRRVIPQLTGGRFEAGTIESGPAERPITPATRMQSSTSSGTRWGTGTATSRQP